MEYEKPDRDLKFLMHYNSKKEGNKHRVSYHMTDVDGETIGVDLQDIEPKELYAITNILMGLTSTFTKILNENETEYWENFEKDRDILGRQIKADIKPEAPREQSLSKKYEKIFI